MYFMFFSIPLTLGGWKATMSVIRQATIIFSNKIHSANKATMHIDIKWYEYSKISERVFCKVL